MPITDYLSSASSATVVALGLRGRLRAWWSRLFKRGEDTVEGHKFVAWK